MFFRSNESLEDESPSEEGTDMNWEDLEKEFEARFTA